MVRYRRDARKDTHHKPLVLLAGLPNRICLPLAKIVQRSLSPNPHVIAQPSSDNDQLLYRATTIAQLFRAASQYSVRQLKASSDFITPTQILLAYVPSPEEERLLTQFDFFVFPVRLTLLAEYADGHQKRHNRQLAEEYVVSALQTALPAFNQLKLRLSGSGWKEPLFLPPLNFNVANTRRMTDIFTDMRRSARWDFREEDIRAVTVTNEDLPYLAAGTSREVLSDCRNLLFPPDRANHGAIRELDVNCSDGERKHLMQSSFRFGIPLRNGFHHDVQYSGDRTLGNQRFDCSSQGSIQLNCKYANIYPNDFVRPSNE